MRFARRTRSARTGLLDPDETVVFRVDAKARSKKKRAKQKLLFRATGDTGGTQDAVRLSIKQKKSKRRK